MDNELKLKKEFIERLIQNVTFTITFDHKTKKNRSLLQKDLNEIRFAVEKAFEKLLEKGVVEIVPVYLLKLNKDKVRVRRKKQLKLGQGYPSPSIIPYPLNMLLRELGL